MGKLLLGLQEVKSQPQNLVADTVLAGEDPWTGRLRQHLAPLGYVKVGLTSSTAL